MHNLSLSNNINFGWIKFVKGVFDNCGYSYEWETHTFITDIWLKQVIKVRLQDQFRQLWLSTLYSSPKGLKYRIFKEMEQESYADLEQQTVNYQLNADAGVIYQEKTEFVQYVQKMKLFIFM